MGQDQDGTNTGTGNTGTGANTPPAATPSVPPGFRLVKDSEWVDPEQAKRWREQAAGSQALAQAAKAAGIKPEDITKVAPAIRAISELGIDPEKFASFTVKDEPKQQTPPDQAALTAEHVQKIVRDTLAGANAQQQLDAQYAGAERLIRSKIPAGVDPELADDMVKAAMWNLSDKTEGFSKLVGADVLNEAAAGVENKVKKLSGAVLGRVADAALRATGSTPAGTVPKGTSGGTASPNGVMSQDEIKARMRAFVDAATPR